MAVPTLAELRPSICLAVRGRDGSGFGFVTGATLSLDERPDAGPDVSDLAAGGAEERLLDVGAHASAGQRRLGDDVELRAQPVADDGELRRGGGLDDPVLRTTIEAAPQVFSRKTRLQAHLDPSAVRCERDVVGPVVGERADVGL